MQSMGAFKVFRVERSLHSSSEKNDVTALFAPSHHSLPHFTPLMTVTTSDDDIKQSSHEELQTRFSRASFELQLIADQDDELEYRSRLCELKPCQPL